MKEIFGIVVDTIIWLIIFKLILLFTGMSEITVLTVFCAYLLARINYIEDTTKDN